MKKLFNLILFFSLTLIFSTNVSAESRYTSPEITRDYFWNGDQIIKTADECYNALDYVLKWGYDGQVILNPKLSALDEDRLDSAILYLAGHGTPYSINLGFNIGVSSGSLTNYKDIDNVDFYQTQLAVLSSCFSASDLVPVPIAEKIYENGASCTLGWEKTTQSPSLKDFNAKFFEHLDNGDTFEDAASGAETDLTNGSQRPTYHPEATIFNYAFFGNKQHTIEKLSRQETNNPRGVEKFLHEGLEQYVITDDVYYDLMSGDFDEIADYIRENINSNFDVNDYTVYEKERSKTVQYKPVYFRYNLYGMETDFGYNILIEDNNAVLITVVGTPISSDTPLTISEDNYTDEELYEIAIDELGFDNDIAEKRASRMILSETGQILYEIEISYYDKGAESVFCVGYSFTE